MKLLYVLACLWVYCCMYFLGLLCPLSFKFMRISYPIAFPIFRLTINSVCHVFFFLVYG